MTMIMRLERTSEEVKTRARHVIICDNYPEKHRISGKGENHIQSLDSYQRGYYEYFRFPAPRSLFICKLCHRKIRPRRPHRKEKALVVKKTLGIAAGFRSRKYG